MCIISHVLQICEHFIMCSFEYTSVKLMKTNISTDLREKTTSTRQFWSLDVVLNVGFRFYPEIRSWILMSVLYLGLSLDLLH